MKLIVFKNVREATKADTACKEMGIEAALVAIPKEISSACGIGLRIDESQEEALKQCIDNIGITYTTYKL
ncbi:MAG: DUF3343 domain-containing protein [Rikenellaceae bacterium]